MLDRLTIPLIVAAAADVTLLEMQWPQGYGSRSIAPFGHIPVQQTPEMRTAMKLEYDKAMRRQAEAAKAVAGTSGPNAAPAAAAQ